MKAIKIIKEKLQKYPQVKFEENENSISIFPLTDDGFTVTLIVGVDDFTVHFNGWHENFENEEKALNCFAFGLSNECRLKEFRRGSEPYKWTLEYEEDGDWIEDSTVGQFISAFWKKETVHYLQNDLIK